MLHCSFVGNDKRSRAFGRRHNNKRYSCRVRSSAGGPARLLCRFAPYQLTCAPCIGPSYTRCHGSNLSSSFTRLCEVNSFTLFDEFDPGSGSTLAACLTHVSRTAFLREGSGERLRNTYAIDPRVGNNARKRVLIPRTPVEGSLYRESRKARADGRAAHQVVGEVMAHQANDG